LPYLLQANLAKELPTFGEMVKYYGPYIGLVLSLIIIILILQSFWFSKLRRAKNKEIERLVQREQQLNERILHLIDKEIGYRKSSIKHQQ
jgi:hypothetical protein